MHPFYVCFEHVSGVSNGVESVRKGKLTMNVVSLTVSDFLWGLSSIFFTIRASERTQSQFCSFLLISAIMTFKRLRKSLSFRKEKSPQEVADKLCILNDPVLLCRYEEVERRNSGSQYRAKPVRSTSWRRRNRHQDENEDDEDWDSLEFEPTNLTKEWIMAPYPHKDSICDGVYPGTVAKAAWSSCWLAFLNRE